MRKSGKIITAVAIIFISAGVFLLVVIARGNRNRVANDRQESLFEERPVPVEVERVETVYITEQVRAIGNVEPFQRVVLYPQVTGTLEKLAVREGDVVNQGQLIAVIEDEKMVLNLKQAEKELQAQKHQLHNMMQDYERFKRLYKEGAVAAKMFEDAETQYKSAEARIEGLQQQIELARRRLRDTRITSPVSGIVSERFIDQGELVTESTMSKTSPLVAISDISKVRITVPVGESDMGKVRIGQRVNVESEELAGEAFRGTVDNIMPVTDIATRTTTSEILVDNPGGRLRQGMFARATITTGRRAILGLSLDALLRMPGSGSYYCFVVEEGEARKRYVETGIIWEGIVEIRKGLKAGDIVAASSHGVLETGTKVSIASDD